MPRISRPTTRPFHRPSLVAEIARLGISQRELTRRIRVGESEFSGMARGRLPVPLRVAEAVARELGVALDALLVPAAEAGAVASAGALR